MLNKISGPKSATDVSQRVLTCIKCHSAETPRRPVWGGRECVPAETPLNRNLSRWVCKWKLDGVHLFVYLEAIILFFSFSWYIVLRVWN